MNKINFSPIEPGWENGQSVLWPFIDCSLTIPWLRIIMAKTGRKKHLKHCDYDSAIKFELAGVGINTIILFFCDKNYKTSYTCHWRQCSGSQLMERLQRQGWLFFQISPQNHNCNALNVFFTALSHNNARLENG